MSTDFIGLRHQVDLQDEATPPRKEGLDLIPQGFCRYRDTDTGGADTTEKLVPAQAAREYLKGLVVGKRVVIRQITEDRKLDLLKDKLKLEKLLVAGKLS